MLEFAGKRVTVAGLGRFGGGSAAARWLAEQGAKVLVTDKASADSLAEQQRQLDGLGISFRLGEHREDDFTGADVVVASPAIAPTNAYLQAAWGAGVPITTEICLFIERCPAPIFGVTGTKGKSTTAALLHRMLGRRGKAWLGGNIGISLLGELGRIAPNDAVVLELSSFMLHYLRQMTWSPHVAVVTMLAADHLEWHGSREEYLAAKRAIVEFQKEGDVAVLNEECRTSLELARWTKGRVIAFGLEKRRPLGLLIPGKHNQLNAQAALAAAQAADVSFDEAQAAVAEFSGLPHRLQLVAQRDGVRYFNDSIATIPEAAVAALDAFAPKTVIQIVGGYDHGLEITAMCGALVERAKAVLCIGAMGKTVAALMERSGSSAAAAVYTCGDLATAMKLARGIAVSGDAILLSPGYKSYDQFANFQERGEAFTRLATEAA